MDREDSKPQGDSSGRNTKQRNKEKRKRQRKQSQSDDDHDDVDRAAERTTVAAPAAAQSSSLLNSIFGSSASSPSPSSLVDSIFGSSSGYSASSTTASAVKRRTASSSNTTASLFSGKFERKTQPPPPSQKQQLKPQATSSSPKMSSRESKKSKKKHNEKRNGGSKNAALIDRSDNKNEQKVSHRRQQENDSTIQHRRNNSKHPILTNEIDFPSAFGKELGADLPEEEKIVEMSGAFKEHGLCVIRNVIDTEVLNNVVLPSVCNLQDRVCDALDRKNIPWRIQNLGGDDDDDDDNDYEESSSSMFRFREGASRCKGRMDVVLKDDALPGSKKDEFQRCIIENETIYNIIRTLFGGDNNVKLVYSGLIFNWPGSSTQPWHQDGQPLFPESRNSIQIQASIPSYAINVFVPLSNEDGEIERGPTEFLPGSHLWSSIAEFDELSNPNKTVVGPSLQQGDVLMYDYRVCHRGTANLSQIENDNPRRILYLMFSRPWFDDHINFDYTRSAKSLWE